MIARRGFLALAAATLLPARAAGQVDNPPALRFSELAPGAPLPDWLEPVDFGAQAKRTEYALVADAGRTVLRARAEASASGLAKTLRVDPAEHPLIAWRWKAANLVAHGGLGSKQRDDFALRLYLTFDLDTAQLSASERMRMSVARLMWGKRLPTAALCYVWDARAPRGTIAPNAYTDRVRMIVVDSGDELLGHWTSHERNMAEDFRAAFGGAAPSITSVIVSADTDNTGESTQAWFGDIVFRRR